VDYLLSLTIHHLPFFIAVRKGGTFWKGTPKKLPAFSDILRCNMILLRNDIVRYAHSDMIFASSRTEGAYHD
jgi:hypothetical protein